VCVCLHTEQWEGSSSHTGLWVSLPQAACWETEFDLSSFSCLYNAFEYDAFHLEFHQCVLNVGKKIIQLTYRLVYVLVLDVINSKWQKKLDCVLISSKIRLS
jgi:hypothetical protein